MLFKYTPCLICTFVSEKKPYLASFLFIWRSRSFFILSSYFSLKTEALFPNPQVLRLRVGAGGDSWLHRWFIEVKCSAVPCRTLTGTASCRANSGGHPCSNLCGEGRCWPYHQFCMQQQYLSDHQCFGTPVATPARQVLHICCQSD